MKMQIKTALMFAFVTVLNNAYTYYFCSIVALRFLCWNKVILNSYLFLYHSYEIGIDNNTILSFQVCEMKFNQ